MILQLLVIDVFVLVWVINKNYYKKCRNRGGGSAIFVSSVGGFQPIPMLGPYSVSKTALLGLTKALAVESAAENIRYD